jgi:MFS family permease
VGLLSGIVADNVRIRSLVIVMMLGQALGIYAATNLVEHASLLIVGLGVSGGLFGPISTVAFPRFFGRAHLGSIAGFEMMLLVIGSALGPSLFATSERVYGSYTPALALALVLPATAVLLALRLREPAPRSVG